jgi:lipoprotein-anchoring transpeptidase ErfK/SrfK
MKLCGGSVLLALWLAGCERAPTPPPAAAPKAQPAESAAPAAPAREEELYQRALALKRDGKLAEARALLQPLAENPDCPEPVLTLLGEINTQIVFGPVPAPEKLQYTIQPGDSLEKIARKFGTTVELLRKANNLRGDLIRAGDRLRIYQGSFAVVVSKSANTLTVTDHGKFFKRYRVGTGEYGNTPVGEFKITTRIAEPPWWRPDGKTIPYGHPENILGTHWLGLDVPGFGIHGTWDTNSIGKQSTAGCIRLLNEEVAELYSMLPPGTPVIIRE